jgi:uncharacterized protein with von Willebrand factor type A (vWA) domain
MTKSLTPHLPELSLAERVRRALAQNQTVNAPGGAGAPPPPAAKTCLLLDVSGSMNQPCEPGRRKIDALRDLVATLGTVEMMYAFSSYVERVTQIPEPEGNTDMARAFARAKADGYDAVVLITDGVPYTDRGEARAQSEAIAAVRGLALQIFYVGPEPKPAFLDRLAAAARAGSRAHQANLRKDAVKQLATRVRGLLEAPRS